MTLHHDMEMAEAVARGDEWIDPGEFVYPDMLLLAKTLYWTFGLSFDVAQKEGELKWRTCDTLIDFDGTCYYRRTPSGKMRPMDEWFLDGDGLRETHALLKSLKDKYGNSNLGELNAT